MAEHVLSEEEVAAILSDESREEERPLRVPATTRGGGNGGSDPTARRKRGLEFRRALAQALVNGSSFDDMVDFFGRTGVLEDGSTGFGMSEAAVRDGIRALLDAWKQEDALLGPHRRAVQARRLQREVAAARRDKAHTAVAALEKVLMQVHGNAAPIKVEGELRLSAAVRSVLGELSHADLQRLVDEELAAQGHRPLRPGEVQVLPSRRP